MENIDVTELVAGHMAYRQSMPRLLREVGWSVTSDEFTEIEDAVGASRRTYGPTDGIAHSIAGS